MKLLLRLLLTLIILPLNCYSQEDVEKPLDIPVNTWVRVSDSPGDAFGREVPPGRGSSWAYSSDKKKFYRYGGFTPRYSNALFSFEPVTKIWKEVVADDENYPMDRAPGVAGPSLKWDTQRKVLWIAGGRSTVNSGKRGVWKFNPDNNKFSFFAKSPHSSIQKLCFALDLNLAVFSLSASMSSYPKNSTYVLDLKTGKSTLIRSKLPVPHYAYQGNFPMTYHSKLKKMIVVTTFRKKLTTWAFDLKTFVWEQLCEGGPPADGRRFFNIAYDVKNNLVILQGGHNGRDAPYTSQFKLYQDTWAFDVEKKKWHQIKIEGPASIQGLYGGKKPYKVLSQIQSFTYAPELECLMLADPDLGVWAMKYDPSKPFSTKSISTGFDHKPGSAVKHAPATIGLRESKIKSNEVRRKLPSGLNPKLINLPDNTMILLKGKVIGDEVAWAFSEKHGVFFKYGGCGNGSAPYWVGYGNDLGYYDPVTEQFYSRRVGDVSGGDRPGTGCTRSVVWDSKRDVVWFLGGTASGPFAPAVHHSHGSHTYDPDKDLFKFVKRAGANKNIGYHTYLSYSPDADIMVSPQDNGDTAHFICSEGRYVHYKNTNSPGRLGNYTRTIYVKSQKATLMIYPIKTGKTSKDKPADFLSTREVAKKKLKNCWSFDKKKKIYEEKTMATYLYHASKKKWEVIATKNQPSFRDGKYGMGYDPVNDVVFVVGGHIGWNGPTVKDFWVYDVKNKKWSEIKPNYPNKKPTWNNALKADYDTRHNVFIFTNKTNRIWAYRYKN